MYPPELTEPIRKDLVSAGVPELRTARDVENFLSQKKGTSLLIINSICGCAAGAARPAVKEALQKGPKPDRVATVFAGVDTEATAKARAAFPDVPPSSPSMYLFKDGELVFVLPRHMIEARTPKEIAADLTGSFGKYCGSAKPIKAKK